MNDFDFVYFSTLLTLMASFFAKSKGSPKFKYGQDCAILKDSVYMHSPILTLCLGHKIYLAFWSNKRNYLASLNIKYILLKNLTMKAIILKSINFDHFAEHLQYKAII